MVKSVAQSTPNSWDLGDGLVFDPGADVRLWMVEKQEQHIFRMAHIFRRKIISELIEQAG